MGGGLCSSITLVKYSNTLGGNLTKLGWNRLHVDQMQRWWLQRTAVNVFMLRSLWSSALLGQIASVSVFGLRQVLWPRQQRLLESGCTQRPVFKKGAHTACSKNTTVLLGSKKSLYTQKFRETCAKMWCKMQNTGVGCKSNLGRSPCPLHSCVEDIFRTDPLCSLY